MQTRPGFGQAAQLEKLRALQSKLPHHEQKRVDLLSMAGRLSEQEFQALTYFIDNRYGVK